MVMKQTPMTEEKRAKILADMHRDEAKRKSGYRERALSLFPHVCGSCGREFSGRRLKELTVHHKDHNHHNNPPDGSNWELLCIYCHDHEHEKIIDAKYGNASSSSAKSSEPGLANPFDNLDSMMGKK